VRNLRGDTALGPARVSADAFCHFPQARMLRSRHSRPQFRA
jgi:hypothetical protein